LGASLSSSLLQKGDGGNAPLAWLSLTLGDPGKSCTKVARKKEKKNDCL
jgi:hypothetical protein